MKCLASTPRSEYSKIKKSIVNDTLETAFVTITYVLITQFKMSVNTVKKILEKVEYYSLIMIDEEESIDLQDYEDILKDEYDFVLDLSKVEFETGTSKGVAYKNIAMKNSFDYVLTIVAYILFDKVGLKKNRVQTIMNRVVYYINIGMKNYQAIDNIKMLLKDEYDCSFGFYR